MVLMTMIARVVDGLPLAATMQEDEQVTSFIMAYITNTYYFPRVTTNILIYLFIYQSDWFM